MNCWKIPPENADSYRFDSVAVKEPKFEIDGVFLRHEVESMLGITLKQTRVYQEIKQEGREEGIEEGIKQGLKAGRKEGLEAATFNLVMRLLSKRFGKISPKICSSISDLSLPVLEDLSENLLDFNNVDDLINWLAKVED